MSSIRVAAAQINPTVGDLAANARAAIRAIEQATVRGVDLVLQCALTIE